jgi:hypothetical protein
MEPDNVAPSSRSKNRGKSVPPPTKLILRGVFDVQITIPHFITEIAGFETDKIYVIWEKDPN